MATIPISEAKAKLANLVREVAATGEAYIISVNGHPMAELRPFVPVPTPGRFKGQIRMDPDALSPMAPGEAKRHGL
jgi:prevent-host-death family protein